MAQEDATDAELMRGAAAGDRAAFGVLVERHGERALRVAMRVLGDGAEAEEVAQEAFLRAWQAAASFDPDRARFTTWLHRITLNLAIDRTRRRGVAPEAGEAALAALPDPAPAPKTAPLPRRTARRWPPPWRCCPPASAPRSPWPMRTG
ncbi:sigma-70 family RNA polymerase sigma factor [Dankookia sp. P2]|uniref:sigma-70 family RNA polymerase sigma factor n=1 Tax=Dankookia sp. P2 TaxID=3423955 RepID=UPI003D67CD55